jgi:sRNA-binding carbon storage regulator CsrA
MSQNATKPATGVTVDVRVGETLTIGSIRITVERKDGQRARLRVVAERSILISRPNAGLKTS